MQNTIAIVCCARYEIGRYEIGRDREREGYERDRERQREYSGKLRRNINGKLSLTGIRE